MVGRSIGQSLSFSSPTQKGAFGTRRYHEKKKKKKTKTKTKTKTKKKKKKKKKKGVSSSKKWRTPPTPTKRLLR
jgi:hypothetical protein